MSRITIYLYFFERISKYNGKKYLFAFHQMQTIKQSYNKGPCGPVSYLSLVRVDA